MTTWMRDISKAGVGACYVVGGSEISVSNGILALPCDDDYGGNSIKLRDAIRQLMTLSLFTHLFVCDDDTFVHPHRWLAHEPEGEIECRIFRNRDRQWVHGGGGWYMSREFCFLYATEVERRTSADDVEVAQIAARHGIELIDRPDLYGGDRYSGSNDRVSASNSLITCHHVQPDEMLSLYQQVESINGD